MATIRENIVILKGVKSIKYIDGSSMATKGRPMEAVNMCEIKQ